MAGNAVSFVVAAAIGCALPRRRVGALGLTQAPTNVGRLGIAGLIAAVPTVIVLVVMGLVWGTEKWASAVQLVVGAAVLVGTYVIAALRLRVSEVRESAAMVRGRLG